MKYIITSVQKGASINKKLLQNMLAFAKDKGVDKIYTFVMNGRYKDDDLIDPLVFESGIETIDSIQLNANLRCRDMGVRAQQVRPFNGLNAKLSHKYSYILPATKSLHQPVANTVKSPRSMISTGALSNPNYKLGTQLGRKAQEMHTFGFVYVQIESNQIFNAYQVESKKNGSFHYLTEKWSGGKSTYSQPEALVLGDWHTGETNKKARAKSIEQLHELKPKRAVFHDIFDGKSINRHETHSFLSKMKNYRDKRDSLDKELKLVNKEINFFASEFPKIQFLVPESNHDVFLERYIDSGEFIENPQNFLLVSAIIPEILKGKRPVLEIALSHLQQLPKNFKFLKENQDFRVRGWDIGKHGHLGPNGSRGTVQGFDRLNMKSVTGHNHTPHKLANAVSVGTNTNLEPNYVRGGPSSWTHANALVYPDGTVALLINILK